MLVAFIVSFLDLVFIFSCPWPLSRSGRELKEFFARLYGQFGIFSMTVGGIFVPLTAFLFIDYFGRPPEAPYRSDNSWSELVLLFGFWVAVPAFPLCLGFILNRISRHLRPYSSCNKQLSRQL
jgi:hypothetical protein